MSPLVTISDVRASQIAQHLANAPFGPPPSECPYARFAVTGEIREVGRFLCDLASAAGSARPIRRHAFQELAAYVRSHGERGPVTGWPMSERGS